MKFTVTYKAETFYDEIIIGKMGIRCQDKEYAYMNAMETVVDHLMDEADDDCNPDARMIKTLTIEVTEEQ